MLIVWYWPTSVQSFILAPVSPVQPQPILSISSLSTFSCIMLNCPPNGTTIQTLPYDRSLGEPQSRHNDGAIDGTTPDGYAITLDLIDVLGPINYRDALGPINTLDLNDSLISDSFLTHHLQYLQICVYLYHVLLIGLLITYSAHLVIQSPYSSIDIISMSHLYISQAIGYHVSSSLTWLSSLWSSLLSSLKTYLISIAT